MRHQQCTGDGLRPGKKHARRPRALRGSCLRGRASRRGPRGVSEDICRDACRGYASRLLGCWAWSQRCVSQAIWELCDGSDARLGRKGSLSSFEEAAGSGRCERCGWRWLPWLGSRLLTLWDTEGRTLITQGHAMEIWMGRGGITLVTNRLPKRFGVRFGNFTMDGSLLVKWIFDP